MPALSTPSMEPTVVLGAGPAGLATAWRLVKAGRTPTVLEKDPVHGGLSLTFESQGYRFDLGPHILHSKYDVVTEFIKHLVGPDLFKLTADQQIIFRGHRVNYPLRGVRVLTSLPPYLMIPAAVNFLWTRMALLFHYPNEEASFEQWITNRFGRILYSIYFGPYVEKVWKIPGGEVSAYVAQQRVPVISIRDMLRRRMGLIPQVRHAEDGHLEKYYCRYGVGQLCDAMKREVLDNGGNLETSCEITAIRGEGQRITSVVYNRAGVSHEIPVGYLFSTIPLPDLIERLQLPIPGKVREAARGLDFCAQRLLYLKIQRPNIPMPSYLYFSDPQVRFNRIYSIGAFGPQCVPEGRSALCVEFTCAIGDDVWTCDDEMLAREVVGILEKYELVRWGEIEGFLSRRLPHVYPRFRVGFQERLDTILDYLKTIPNLRTLGRHGLFSYANIDDVIQMSFSLCDQLLREKP